MLHDVSSFLLKSWNLCGGLVCGQAPALGLLGSATTWNARLYGDTLKSTLPCFCPPTFIEEQRKCGYNLRFLCFSKEFGRGEDYLSTPLPRGVQWFAEIGWALQCLGLPRKYCFGTRIPIDSLFIENQENGKSCFSIFLTFYR
jgi:hypothetical protein